MSQDEELFGFFAEVRRELGVKDLTQLPVNAVACFHEGLTPADVRALVEAEVGIDRTAKRSPRWARRLTR